MELNINSPVYYKDHYAFVKIQDKSKQDFLVGLIREKDAFPFTMEMLGRWKSDAALPIIIERLEVDTIKTSAITALGKYKDISLLPYIEPFINSTKREQAASVSGRSE